MKTLTTFAVLLCAVGLIMRITALYGQAPLFMLALALVVAVILAALHWGKVS
jgi:hypothetical protein